MFVLSAMLLVVGSTLFVARLNLYRGHRWADRVCDVASGFCTDAQWLALLGLMLLGVTVLRRLVLRRR